MTKEQVLIIYGIFLGAMTLLTFIVYGVDKLKAVNGLWRISEAFLLICSILGGALGGFLAMRIFRHKTAGEHWYFTVINILFIILHIALLLCIAFVFEITASAPLVAAAYASGAMLPRPPSPV